MEPILESLSALLKFDCSDPLISYWSVNSIDIVGSRDVSTRTAIQCCLANMMWKCENKTKLSRLRYVSTVNGYVPVFKLSDSLTIPMLEKLFYLLGKKFDHSYPGELPAYSSMDVQCYLDDQFPIALLVLVKSDLNQTWALEFVYTDRKNWTQCER